VGAKANSGHDSSLVSVETVSWPQYLLELRGNVLSRYSVRLSEDLRSKNKVPALDVIFLDESWSVLGLDDFEFPGLRMKGPGDVGFDFFVPTNEHRDIWRERIMRCIIRGRTHGIDIQTVAVNTPLAREFFANKPGRLELSVWDFAGQSEYYAHHQHFLTERSVFLVLWNVAQHVKQDSEVYVQEKGIASLEYWFSSLAFHLGRHEAMKGYFTLIVVGTHLDMLTEEQQKKFNERMVWRMAWRRDIRLRSLHTWRLVV
jgi:GTPase SAR1 family protein